MIDELKCMRGSTGAPRRIRLACWITMASRWANEVSLIAAKASAICCGDSANSLAASRHRCVSPSRCRTGRWWKLCCPQTLRCIQSTPGNWIGSATGSARPVARMIGAMPRCWPIRCVPTDTAFGRCSQPARR